MQVYLRILNLLKTQTDFYLDNSKTEIFEQSPLEKNLNSKKLKFTELQAYRNHQYLKIKEEVKQNPEEDKVAKQSDVQKNSKLDRQNLRTIDFLPRLQLNNSRISKNQFDYNQLRTRQFEKQVIRYFGELYKVPQECELWGYMPSGSTESNLQAIYFAREYFRNHQNVAVIYTEKAHSSLNKAIYYLKLNTFGQVARSLNLEPPAGMKQWPDKVPHNSAGQMDIDSLKAILKPLAEQKIPVLIIANVGTTSTCSFDSTTEIINALKTQEFYNDLKNHWIHIDGAWCGPYIRFLEIASRMSKHKFLPIKTINEAKFDFSLKEVKSITTSIHKWIPSPILIQEVKIILQLPQEVGMHPCLLGIIQ
ncbi:glutamate decarboxylase [Stylonychia lemnae]|uniref:Glutamate decarboxylase n=1 Tax=Stylonychia lemnae TaxID=5949 RepID=A0A077ZS01_STYLE|nr:glutamate decarboxylase [Stylonychia lemnae]|eukprot:CDW72683.1 glutamate decarboxylase [Stylonychia lemnae]